MDAGHDDDDDDDTNGWAAFLIRRRRPSCILPDKLWLGDYRGAHDDAFLKDAGIRAILSLGSMEDHVHYRLHPDMQHHFVFIDDNEREPIHEHFDECVAFIRDAQGPVYVHCWAGISRSATIVLAYLILEKGMEMKDAWQWVKSKRPAIGPNDGFMDALWKLTPPPQAATQESPPHPQAGPLEQQHAETKL
jgi:hypothetical protein